MRTITEGTIHLAKCADCQKWHKEADLCTNERNYRLQCSDCYVEWLAEEADLEIEDDRDEW